VARLVEVLADASIEESPGWNAHHIHCQDGAPAPSLAGTRLAANVQPEYSVQHFAPLNCPRVPPIR
jgi:hypothetical protein